MRLSAAAAIALALLVSACGDDHDHGSEVPTSAGDAVGCVGAPYARGSGNYDSGPENVQDDARKALDDWLEQEGSQIPDVQLAETSRHGDAALFTWTENREVLAAFVVHDDTDGLDGDRGWGVTSYAVCDPAEWPPERSDEIGIEVWSNADGDRVPTSLIHSERGPAPGTGTSSPASRSAPDRSPSG